MKVNTQPAEKPAPSRPDGAVEVVSIFDTLQGEGPFAGTPAVFVRLAGCSLLCPNCDTDYTSRRVLTSPNSVVEQVRRHGPKRKLVVITGGEPLRQDISETVLLLLRDGRRVQIETNGTLYLPGLPYDRITVVCSPKAGVNKKLAPHVTAWKYVLREGAVDPHDGLPLSALGMDCKPGRPHNGKAEIFVQPEDEQDDARNRLNLEACVESCMKHGYRLTCQLHKAASLP